MSKIPEDFLKSIAKEHHVSEAEFDALRLALSGQTAEESSQVLGISAVAVRKRLGSIYQKFHIAGNTPGKLEALRSLIEKYHSSQTSSIQPHQDWGEAPDVSKFYGREEELDILEQWILNERCRLIALLGMGGIGKTALSVKLALRVEKEFDYVVWLSLRSAPPILEVLTHLLEFFRSKENLPKDVNSKTRFLINEYLKKHRCLIVLDNLESILKSDTKAGYYKKEYENYGNFLQLIGESEHSSCVLLTSREKPKEVASLEKKTLLKKEERPIKSLQLIGLKEASRKIFVAEGLSESEEKKWSELIDYYNGNPLALRIVAATVREYFCGNTEQFLEQGKEAFGDIRDLFTEQLERLSDLEKKVMYWLAIERELVSILELRENFVFPPSAFELLEAVESLRRRSLIEVSKDGASFTLQNVVIEYLYGRLIKQICEEIKTKELDFFNNYTLLKATAKEYVRKAQERLIIEPIKEKLLALFKKPECLEERLKEIILMLQEESSRQPGYAAGNILNLLCLLKQNLLLEDYDFSNLAVWQAYISETILHNADLTGANLAKFVFARVFPTILSISFSSDGELLVAGDAKGEISLWRVADSERLWSYQKHDNRIRSVAFSPDNDNKKIASGSEDGTVILWDVETGECNPLHTLQEHEGRVWSVAFSPDGKLLASGGDDHKVILWDVETGECLDTKRHKDWVVFVTFSPDGKLLASGSNDNTVKLWNVEIDGKTHTNIKHLRTLPGHDGRVWSIAFRPNESDVQILASSSEDQTVKFWDLSKYRLLKTWIGYTNRFWSVAFNHDGTLLASGSDDSIVRLWDAKTGECSRYFRGHEGRVWSVAFSPDGKLLASSGNDGKVILWNIETGQYLHVLQEHEGWVWSVAFSPDGKLLASGGDDCTVRLWDVETGQYLPFILNHDDRVRSVAFNHDTTLLAIGSDDGKVRLWNLKALEEAKKDPGEDLQKNLEEGKYWKTLGEHKSWVWSVAFSPDGKLLASGGDDGKVILWNIETDQKDKYGEILVEHEGRVWSVAFSPDGKLLASGGDDGKVILWNIEKGESYHTFSGHTKWVRSVAFTPIKSEKLILASSGEDETIKLWDVVSKKELEPLKKDRIYENMKIKKVTGLTEVQKETLKALGAIT